MTIIEYSIRYNPYSFCKKCDYANVTGCCLYDIHGESICDRERIFKEGFEAGVKAMIDANMGVNESS